MSGALLPWCQIDLVPNCPVPNCPVAKMYGAKFPWYRLWLARKIFRTYLFYTTHILHIFDFDTNLQYFAFSYILIICSLHLHEFSYNSQIHNVLTRVNTLHISEWNYFLLHFFLFDDLRDWEVGVYDTLWCRQFPNLSCTKLLSLFQFCLTLTFSINHPTQSHFEKNCTSVTLLLFSIIHPTLSHPIQLWNDFAVLFDFHFFNYLSHPIPLFNLCCIS